VQVAGAEKIAAVSAQCGVPRLVHVSHLNASATSPSKYYQTKALGEERVKAVFPAATIIRPGAMFGFEDKLLNNIASASRGFSAAMPGLQT
jgi:NADH dehydrogenase (ubiquinone) 1 alpha subcomplex subunit 9